MLSAKRDDPAYGSVVDTAALGTHVRETSEDVYTYPQSSALMLCEERNPSQHCYNDAALTQYGGARSFVQLFDKQCTASSSCEPFEPF